MLTSAIPIGACSNAAAEALLGLVQHLLRLLLLGLVVSDEEHQAVLGHGHRAPDQRGERAVRAAQACLELA